jgi:phosphatidylglycerophosphate synthase
MVEGRSRLLLQSALRSVLAAMLVGAALAWFTNSSVHVRGSFSFTAMVLLCVGGLLVLWRLREHHPFDTFGIANQITLARGVLVMLLLAFVGAGSNHSLQVAAFWIAFVSSSMDVLDGWAARRTHTSSAYGARFDMETDALLILTLSVLTWQFDKAGAWVLGSGAMRYAFVATSLALPWLQHPLPSSLRRKAVAVMQTVALVIAIAPWVSQSVSVVLCACALAALAWSFLVDIVWLRRHSSGSVTAT